MSSNIQTYSQSYFASCAVGLEEVLSKEIQALGGKKVTLERGGVEFKGPGLTALKAVLYSRIASRVYKKLYSAPIRQEKDIYNMSNRIHWDTVFNLEQTFKIRALVGYGIQTYFPDSFKNSIYLGQTLKDGIVDVFRTKFQKRPDVNTEKADVNILLRISISNQDKRAMTAMLTASIYLDLCGNSLHQRGYRISVGEAPVKENMAAGIIKLMEWDHEKEIFIDSMCGSGTFLIEAALIKGDIPPSFLKVLKLTKNSQLKPWNFLGLKFFTDDPELKNEFAVELAACKQKIDDGYKRLKADCVKIFGFDINTDTTRSCAENINSILLSEVIKVRQIDSTKLKWTDDSKGVIFCNAPYGERLGGANASTPSGGKRGFGGAYEDEKLKTLYFEYGENLKNNFKGFKAYVFTGNPEMKDSIQLAPSRKFPLFNGPIECRLLKYELY
jgi:putative N6-adenine-specific DNA methylase